MVIRPSSLKTDKNQKPFPEEHNLDTADGLAKDLLQVAVIGVTCAGKTTLVNALVGEELLPASIDINTGAIVKIVHGENTDKATLVEGGVPRTVTREIFRDFIQIPAESMGSILPQEEAFALPERLIELDYAELPHDNRITRHNIILVDTLGFNAGPKVAAVTERFLTEADAVIVVLLTTPPITESTVELIRDRVGVSDTAQKVENMFFVVNDFGTVSPHEKKQLMEENLPRRLGELLGHDASLFSRRVFFLNAKKALEARVSGASAESLEETGLPQFEQTLLDAEEHRYLIRQAATRSLAKEEHSASGKTAPTTVPEAKSNEGTLANAAILPVYGVQKPHEAKSSKDTLANAAAEKSSIETEPKRNLVPHPSTTNADKAFRESKEALSPEPEPKSTKDITETAGGCWPLIALLMLGLLGVRTLVKHVFGFDLLDSLLGIF